MPVNWTQNLAQIHLTRSSRVCPPSVDGEAPSRVGWAQLWSSLRLGALQGMHSFADWHRLLGLQPMGPFAPVWLTRNGLVKRLLQAGLAPWQEIWESVSARLAHAGQETVPAALAAFATDILCLDETRLDTLGRYLKPLRGLSTHDPACFAGKLVGLFDLRTEAVVTAPMARGGTRELQSG